MSAVRGRDRGTQAPIRAQGGAQSCWGRCELGPGVYESWQNQIVGLERDGSSSVAPKVWIIGHCVWFNLTHALGYQSQSSLNLNLQYGEAADGSTANRVSEPLIWERASRSGWEWVLGEDSQWGWVLLSPQWE